jgi:DNA-binding CsgD family transcriptional regulator
MNYLLNLQLHWLPLVFICIELIFLIIQLWEIWKHPHIRRQWWYVVLLLLLLFFNLVNGQFPDNRLPVDIRLQYILAYGASYLLGAYFPFYFYKNFRLEKLRFHATWGVCLFLLLPYLVFNVLLYLLNGKLIPDREWGVLIPAAYGILVLAAIYRAITQKHRENTDWPAYREAFTVWIAILPWEAMSVLAFYPVAQEVHIVIANLGWLVVTFFMMTRAARAHQARHKHYKELTREVSYAEYEAACRALPISEREMDVALLFREGLTSAQIAERLFIEQGTVQTHIHHILKKTGCKDRKELLARLLTPPSSPGKP